MLVHICNLSTVEVQAEESRVQGHPGLHSGNLPSQKKNMPVMLLLIYPR
jgi:hypothetical protein